MFSCSRVTQLFELGRKINTFFRVFQSEKLVSFPRAAHLALLGVEFCHGFRDQTRILHQPLLRPLLRRFKAVANGSDAHISLGQKGVNQRGRALFRQLRRPKARFSRTLLQPLREQTPRFRNLPHRGDGDALLGQGLRDIGGLSRGVFWRCLVGFRLLRSTQKRPAR